MNLLAICIPTHQGRKATLAELLESIAIQASGLADDVEVCISDNASQDGTEQMLGQLVSRFPIPIRYFRFDLDQGVRNFFNVVEMARSEYCWIIGSDDALPEGSLRHVVRLLKANPGTGGVTLNKFNFDRLLETPVGTDHPIVLPREWPKSRQICGYDEIVDNLLLLFLFLSAHVFRRDLWLDAAAGVSAGEIAHFRHFVHSLMYLRVARQNPRWLWNSTPAIVQRLGNSCVLEAEGDSGLEFAIQVTEDTMKFAEYAHAGDRRRVGMVKRKLYLMYWNPLSVASYKNGSFGSLRADWRILRFCAVHFWREPLFWMTGSWLCLAPYFLLRPPLRLARSIYLRFRGGGEGGAGFRGEIFNLLLRLLGVEGSGGAGAGPSEDAMLGDRLACFLDANRMRIGLSVKHKSD
jgi:glycosyltransferase involved in cell wall biosynthesis